jgi:hypothetical protein
LINAKLVLRAQGRDSGGAIFITGLRMQRFIALDWRFAFFAPIFCFSAISTATAYQVSCELIGKTTSEAAKNVKLEIDTSALTVKVSYMDEHGLPAGHNEFKNGSVGGPEGLYRKAFDILTEDTVIDQGELIEWSRTGTLKMGDQVYNIRMTSDLDRNAWVYVEDSRLDSKDNTNKKKNIRVAMYRCKNPN